MEHGLGTLLRHVTAHLDGDLQAIYDEIGVPIRPRFYPIIRQLVCSGPVAVGELAEAAAVTQPAATQTIAEMAKVGLVTIAKGRDGRKHLVSLTSKGSEIARQLRPVWGSVATSVAELDGELSQPLSQFLSEVLEALDREPFRDRIRRAMKNG